MKIELIEEETRNTKLRVCRVYKVKRGTEEPAILMVGNKEAIYLTKRGSITFSDVSWFEEKYEILADITDNVTVKETK